MRFYKHCIIIIKESQQLDFSCIIIKLIVVYFTNEILRIANGIHKIIFLDIILPPVTSDNFNAINNRRLILLNNRCCYVC